ncbi:MULTISPECIES: acyl-CoA dehydrogenase family protein [unclassified Polaromonas]|uniref:acyl-CoA dehydrogenase family protein n=1 Tax=unclassified Polaromonas TaxID=2638319 RepID=UPI000BBBE492|nr:MULTISPECIES: acyl-CoA dehydrogenase [unclassified Polaromonas]MDI1274781.1 acyl-CoA dehydrogenase [Polaromonas sp.]
MDFTIDPDTVAISEAVLRFVEREVLPLQQRHHHLLGSERTLFDASGRYVPEALALRQQVRKRSAELGFYTLFGDEKLGGGGQGAQVMAHVQEVLNHRVGPPQPLVQTVVLPSPFTNGLSPVLRHLKPDIFAHYRDGIASGDKTLCFALSEPDAGSDAFGMKTRAVRDGDEWVLTGTKQWITNSPYADYAMVFALTDPEAAARHKGGVTGFFVDTRAPGFSVPRIINTMGHLGGDTGVIVLDGVRVRDDHRLGEVGRGLAVAMDGVNAGRMGMAASCLGLARWALDQAVEYAKVRKTFGVPIAEHQAIQLMLADSAMDIYAAKTMIQNCAWRIDNGQSATAQVSMVKAFSTEMLGRVMDRSIQIHGGMGLTNELRLEEGYRFARVMRIPDGTGEIQRRTIARQLLTGQADL